MSRSTTPTLQRTSPPVWNPSAPNSVEVVIDLAGHVDVSGKEITSLSEKQLRIVAHNIISMNASKNQFATLDFLKHLPRIVVLNASYNRLRRIFSIVYAKSTLEKVDLSHNAIGTVEHFLSQMVRLRVLNLSFNQLMTFPLVNELTELTELNLSSNHLTQLPDLKRLTNLTVLNLSLNGLTTIKDATNRFPLSLLNLNLCENQISDLTEVGFLKMLTQLQSLGFAGNSATLGKFNYRPFVASRLITLNTIDENDLSDEELLLGQRFHLGKMFASFYPGCDRQCELVEILTKQSPLGSNPFSALTPINPRLLNVKQDFVHNRSDLDSTSSLSEADSTPKRITRSVPDIRHRSNLRVISPLKGKRLPSIIAPVNPHINVKLPDLLSPELDSRESESEADSARSTDTVVMTESISLQLDLETPVVEPLKFPTATPTPEPRPEPFSPDLSCVQEVTEPESNLEVSSTLQKSKSLMNSLNESSQGISKGRSTTSTPTKTVSQMVKDESLLQSMTTQKLGWTNIVKESPFPSLISDEPSAESLKVSFKSVTPKTVQPAMPPNERTPTTPRAEKLKPILQNAVSTMPEIRQQATETLSAEVLKRLDDMEQLLKNLSIRVKALESDSASSVSFPDYSNMMRMFLPMPTKVQISPESDDTTIVSWETISPVLPTIRGYAVYVDDQFHTEIKNPVIRFRCPIQGRRIAIEAISATNSRSLRAEIIAPNCIKDKENIETNQKRILNLHSARI